MIVKDTDKVTAKTLGYLFGVTDRQIRNLRDTVFKEAQVKGAKSYDLVKAIEAWVEYNQSGKAVGSKGEAETRLLLLRGDKAEIEIATLEGGLIPMSECSRMIVELTTIFINALQSTPARHTDIATRHKQAPVLMNEFEKECDNVRRSVYTQVERYQSILTSADDHSAPA